MKKIFKLFQFYNFYSLVIIYRYFIFMIYKKINSKGVLLTNVFNYKMLIPLQYDGIGRRLYVYGSRELDHKWMIDKEISPGNIILD